MRPALRPSRWRSFRTAAWLGWQIESNWADPFLFAVYSMIKPLAGAAILVMMYGIISHGNFRTPVFAYIYLGNAFYMYVAALLTGISLTVMEDREKYRTLKYIYVAPAGLTIYLLGRGVARLVTTTVAVGITLAAGMIFLHLPIHASSVHWPLLGVSLLLGLGMLACLGLILAAVSLLLVNHDGGVHGEAVAAALYLFSGAIFPLDVLPAWLRPLGYVLPISYWLELLRRALLGPLAANFPWWSGLGTGQLLAILAALTAVLVLLAVLLLRACEHTAREQGTIDRVTNY